MTKKNHFEGEDEETRGGVHSFLQHNGRKFNNTLEIV